MEFLNIVKDLVHQYDGNIVRRKNNTLLLGPGHIPKCEHMLFARLPRQLYEEHLIKQYKNKFPEEYLYLLEHINGADFHWLRINMENGDGFAYSLLTIFGLPITPPFARAMDMEEPFDVRIEDLNRTVSTPDSWLKFGQYIYDLPTDEIRDLYIDTETGRVMACLKKKKLGKNKIIQEWDNMDLCLCEVFRYTAKHWEEYRTNQGTVRNH